MTRWTPPLAVSLLALGCGGTSLPAESPPAAAAAAAPAATPAAAPTAAADKPVPDGWEGEGDAKDQSAAAGTAKPVTAAAASKTETRTPEVMRQVVLEHRPLVRDCYEKARKDLPSLQGDMVLHLVIDPEGKVKTIELNAERSTLKSPAVVDCAVSALKSVTFPPSSRGMESVMNYPFNLMPGGPAQH
jgi:hypothetical protein